MMRRAGRLAGAAAVAAGLAFASADASAQSAPASWTEANRIEVIARVSRSVVHVKGVGETPPPLPPAASGGSSRSRKKVSADLEEMLRTLGGKDPREPRREEGTGFVFDSGRGLVLTAAHIVDRAKTLTVVLPGGGERAAELVGIDSDHGVAVVRVTGITLPALTIATRQPRAGETSLVIGFMIPVGSVLASQGMVMGALATDKLAGMTAPASAKYYALDNLLPHGAFGGGPAVDTAGNVIGLVSAVYSRGGFGQEAMTLVIALASARPVIERLIAGEASAGAKSTSSP